MRRSVLLFSIVSLGFVSSVAAVPGFGPCGGEYYTGGTTCDCPYQCVIINPYFYECLAEPYGVDVNGATTTTYVVATPTCTTTTSVPRPTSTSRSTTSTTTSSAPSPTTTCIQADPVGPPTCGGVTNPYWGPVSVFINPDYTANVNAAAALLQPRLPSLVQQIRLSAQIPNFIWLDKASKVSTFASWVDQAFTDALQYPPTGATTLFQVVLYDIPDRDCHNAASTGEFSVPNNGVAGYKTFIDSVATVITQYPSFRFVVIVEPNALANLVTNLSDQRCANVDTIYQQCISYVLQKLNQCNVWLYLDAGHAGWLGWPADLGPAATLFSRTYNSTQPNRVRGLATNVGNYNVLSTNSPDIFMQGNPNYDELHYINALVPLLAAQGFPTHFIVDQSRSGRQGIRTSWSDWCNVALAGFGLRPGRTELSCWIDQIAWVKPGGESDGTSNTSEPLFDSACAQSYSKKPAPDAGAWFEAYFEDLVNYANPSFL